MLSQSSALTQSQPLVKHQINATNMSINTIQTKAVDKKLILYALGIFVTYFYFGILQEKM